MSESTDPHAEWGDYLLEDMDLTLKLVEVKGPRDRLDDRQKVWLETFVQAGIPAEVCQVVEKNKDNFSENEVYA